MPAPTPCALQNEPPRKKDLSVETLRGVAILLVVMGHVVYELGQRDLIDAGNVLSRLTDALDYLRMPLFTVISGFVYAMRPVRAGGENTFIIGKLRRVLLPFLSIGLIQVVYADYRSDGSFFTEPGSAFLSIFILNSSHLWYLKAMLWIFLLTVVLDAAGAINRVQPWLIMLGISIIASMSMAGDERWLVQFMAIGNTLYILPYFFFGLGIKRFEAVLFNPKVLVLAALLLTAGTLLNQLWLVPLDDAAQPGAVSAKSEGYWLYLEKLIITSVGLSATLLLFRFRRTVPGLSKLGSHAYAIYLFHGYCYFVVFSVTTKKAWPDVGTYSLFALMMLGGLLIPIALKMLIVRWKISRRLLLGLR